MIEAMKKYMWFGLLLLVCAPLPARASDLTLFGAAQREGKLTLQSTGGAFTSLNARNFGTFGVRFSEGHVIGSEHTLSYSPNFISTQSHAVIYHSNFLVQAPLPFVRPFATVGLGAVFIGGNLAQALRGTKFALNYGGWTEVEAGRTAGSRGGSARLQNFWPSGAVHEYFGGQHRRRSFLLAAQMSLAQTGMSVLPHNGGGDSPGVHEETRSGGAKNEAADVRHIGNATA